MNASSRMILWQLWRQTKDEIFWAIVGQYGILGLLLLVAHTHLSSMFHLLMPVFFVMSFFMAVPTVAFLTLRASEGNPRNAMPFPLHLDFVQPVPTFTLVFLCMTYSCVKAAMVYLAVAIPVHLGIGQPMPLLPYVYWLMVMAAALQAIMWIPATQAGRAWGYVLGVGGTSLLFLRHVFIGPGGTDNLLETPEPLKGLFTFTPAGYLGLGLLAVGALAVAVAGVERQRHGERLFPRLRSGSAAPARPRSSAARRFTGPVQAQLWCEARRSLPTPMLLPLLAAAAMLLVSAITLPIPDEVEFELLAVLWTFVVVGTILTTHLLAGHLSCALRFRGGAWSYSTFEATLPMGTGSLTLIKIGTILASGVLAAALLTFATAIALLPHLGQEKWVEALSVLLRESSNLWGGLSLPQRLALLYFSILWTLSIPPLLFSFSEAGVAYPSRLNSLLALCIADMCLAALLMLLRYPLHLYGMVNAWVLAALAAGVTVWAVYRILERGYMDKRLFIVCATLWAISVGIWCALGPQLPLRLGVQFALLLAPMLAVALPPLTLAANRHR